MKKQAILLFLLALSISTFAQSSLNDYKLVEIPSKFKFQKEKNQFRINTTLKIFFQNKGFEVFFDDEIQSADFAASNCNKGFVSVVDDSNLLVTKLTIEIKDCTNKVLFTSDPGTSRRKDYGTAYNESLIMALKSFNKAHYKYKEKAKAVETNTYASSNAKEIVTDKSKPAMTFSKTSNPEVYMVTSGDKKGLAIKKGEEWFFEYYEGDKLISEKIEVKF